MTPEREKWIAAVIITIFLIAISIPFLIAQSSSGDARVFGGFLLNPIDGNSYLAKMNQGYEGTWTFKLPYTANPGEGTPLNLYYLFLGRLSRWFSWSLILTFHFARIVGALLLAISLLLFFQRIFSLPSSRLLSLGLALFGSGFGWLAACFTLTSDFWVAEAYPFLASFANAHFPLGLALQVWLITPLAKEEMFTWRRAIATLVAASLLSIIYPFGWLVAIVVLSVWLAWLFWKQQAWKTQLVRWGCVLIGGAPYVFYSLWLVNSHPVLAQWNAQNVTPAPDLIDLAISFSPAVILAAFGIFALWRKGAHETLTLLALWVILGAVILYLPIGLQRRLISGLFIPISGLAVLAVQQLKSSQLRRGLIMSVLLLSLPTNILIISGGMLAAREQDPAIFVYRDELEAFSWLDINAQENSLVLASPETGLLIPAYSSMRVLYGHPFETVQAGERLGEVYAFFLGDLDEPLADDLLSVTAVDYVFYGPRENDIGPLPDFNQFHLVFARGDVQIYGQK